jgi:UDP-4-amino-4,6-dideoxy-N-acetyl-beta-L-altrosamine transaminase
MKIMYPYARQTITKDDINAVVNVLKSPFLTQGPVVVQFERALCKYTGAKYAVAVSSATAGLHMACIAAGITPGDEGITSPITFVASANCIIYCGGKVKFADIDSSTGLIDPEKIRKEITSKTKVIIPVHYAGQSCDMETIHAIAKKHNIYIIEDAAHAIGSEYKGSKVGSCKYSDMTVFSFHPVKTITTGEGGAITTNNKELYKKLLLLRTHGITKDPSKFIDQTSVDKPWYYEMQSLGFNYRMTDIQAALGISQMNQLKGFIKRRNEITYLYDRIFSNYPTIKPLTRVLYGTSCRHLYVLRIEFTKAKISREHLMDKLKGKEIGTQVHYIPAYEMPYYKKLIHKDFPISQQFYNSVLSIPLYPELSDADVRKIAFEIIKIITQ